MGSWLRRRFKRLAFQTSGATELSPNSDRTVTWLPCPFRRAGLSATNHHQRPPSMAYEPLWILRTRTHGIRWIAAIGSCYHHWPRCSLSLNSIYHRQTQLITCCTLGAVSILGFTNHHKRGTPPVDVRGATQAQGQSWASPMNHYQPPKTTMNSYCCWPVSTIILHHWPSLILRKPVVYHWENHHEGTKGSPGRPSSTKNNCPSFTVSPSV